METNMNVNNTNTVSRVSRAYRVSQVSWRAVFAGTAIAVIVQVTLLLLGMAIGLFSVGGEGARNPFAVYGTVAYIWWAISGIISLFVGGWVTSRFAGLQQSFDGVLHGIVTWAMAAILTLFVLTSVVGGVLGGAFSVMGSVVSGTGQAIGAAGPELAQAVMGNDPLKGIFGEGQDIIDQVRVRGGEQAVTELTSAARDIFKDGEVTQTERQRAVTLLTQYSAMNEQDATQAVNDWSDMYGKVKDQARKTAEGVADALAKAALWAFITLLLGAVAAGLGGRIGRIQDTDHLTA